MKHDDIGNENDEDCDIDDDDSGIECVVSVYEF